MTVVSEPEDYADGTRRWFVNNRLHRDGGPAIEYADGTREWYVNGMLHRVGGPAIEYGGGNAEWWLHGQRHRDDGPAIEYAGDLSWYSNGKRHRLDAPAIEYDDGRQAWWIDGVDLGWDQANADIWLALTPDQQTFTRAHLTDVGEDRTWTTWAALFTSATDICPAPVRATRRTRATRPTAPVTHAHPRT